jgi:hypothetical protein
LCNGLITRPRKKTLITKEKEEKMGQINEERAEMNEETNSARERAIQKNTREAKPG